MSKIIKVEDTLEKLAAELDAIASSLEKTAEEDKKTYNFSEMKDEKEDKKEDSKEEKKEDEKEDSKEEKKEDEKEEKKAEQEPLMQEWGSVEETKHIKGKGKLAGYRDPIEAFAMGD